MPTPTYDLIEEKVLSSAAPSVTFNSIPGTYKDLVLECVDSLTSGATDVWYQINGDTGSNYSSTILDGNGTAAASTRQTSANKIYLGFYGYGNTGMAAHYVQFMSYANANVYKTCLGRAGNAALGVDAIVGLWRSTSAITSITVFPTSPSTWATGSTFRLWGVAG